MPGPCAAAAQAAVARVTCGAGSRKGQDSPPQLSRSLGAAEGTGAEVAGHPPAPDSGKDDAPLP